MNKTLIMFGRKGRKKEFELFVYLHTFKMVVPWLDLTKWKHKLDNIEFIKIYNGIDTRQIEKDIFDLVSIHVGSDILYLDEIYCKKSFIAFNITNRRNDGDKTS